MTKKDYVKFAAMLRSHECPMGANLDRLGGWNQCRDELTGLIADIFQVDNPNFDRDRFLNACEVES